MIMIMNQEIQDHWNDRWNQMGVLENGGGRNQDFNYQIIVEEVKRLQIQPQESLILIYQDYFEDDGIDLSFHFNL